MKIVKYSYQVNEHEGKVYVRKYGVGEDGRVYHLFDVNAAIVKSGLTIAMDSDPLSSFHSSRQWFDAT